jgi:deazaflavin-dependent oxidoreductase (nitroreductase family)
MREQQTAGGQAAGSPVRTMKGQAVVNRVMRGLLRTPLLARLVGSRLLTLYVVGRKSGQQYAIPVAYTRDSGDLLIGTPFGWARNLRTGEPVEIQLQGRRRQAGVEVIADEPGVVDAYATMARDNHNFAKFNRVGFDADGNPRPVDLHQAWATGARAFRLTPR